MSNHEKQRADFERQFIKDQLVQVAQASAKVGIATELFEALLITLADELDFKDIMQVSKEKVQ